MKDMRGATFPDYELPLFRYLALWLKADQSHHLQPASSKGPHLGPLGMEEAKFHNVKCFTP